LKLKTSIKIDLHRSTTLVLTITALILTGCGLPPDEQARPPSADVIFEREYPMPELAEDIAPLIGKSISSAFAEVSNDCVGNLDQLVARYGQPRPGVRLSGWGYDLGASEGFQILIATDSQGVIRGGGLGGSSRPDVFNARAGEVTSESTGYDILAEITEGSISVFGIDHQTNTICLVGLFQLAAASD